MGLWFLVLAIALLCLPCWPFMAIATWWSNRKGAFELIMGTLGVLGLILEIWIIVFFCRKTPNAYLLVGYIALYIVTAVVYYCAPGERRGWVK